MTLVRNEVGRIFRIWSQTLLPPAVTMALYFIIFGSFIGSQVQDIDGYSYMQFIVPGLVMMSVITSSYMHVVSSFYLSKFQKNIEELLVSPMPSWAIIAGYVSGGVARGILVGIMVIGISLFFTHLELANVAVIFGAAILTTVLFSVGGLLNGMFAKSFDAMTIIPTFVLTPLTYLGGVFYSIDQLPEIFRILSLFNPILYMVNAFRYGFLGVSDVPLWICFAVMFGFATLFIGIAAWFFKTGTGLKS